MTIVKIRITTKGETTYDVSGMEGTECETLTEALMRDQGDVIETNYKGEYVQVLPDTIETYEE